MSRNVYAVNMTNKGNSVNIKRARGKSSRSNSGYHHGDLRAEAIKAGLELLDDNSTDDPGLRQIARHIGVSATALYRHFPDKDALLKALALEGLEQLGQIQRNSATRAGGGRAGFEEMGITYVEFAVQNPALFRLTFTQSGTGDPLEENTGSAGLAAQNLSAGIAELMPDEMSASRRKVAALHAWSVVHGLALLVLDKQIAYDRDLIREVVVATKLE